MVLAVQTTEVAASASKRQARCARMKMIKRLFLYRVDGKSTRLSINIADEYSSNIATASANTRFTVSYTAMMRTKQTTYRSVACLFIVFAFYKILHVVRRL